MHRLVKHTVGMLPRKERICARLLGAAAGGPAIQQAPQRVDSRAPLLLQPAMPPEHLVQFGFGHGRQRQECPAEGLDRERRPQERNTGHLLLWSCPEVVDTRPTRANRILRGVQWHAETTQSSSSRKRPAWPRRVRRPQRRRRVTWGSTRGVVGWSMGISLERGLVIDALQQAIQRRRPAAGLIHHSAGQKLGERSSSTSRSGATGRGCTRLWATTPPRSSRICSKPCKSTVHRIGAGST